MNDLNSGANTIRVLVHTFFGVLFSLLLVGCATPAGSTRAEKRASVIRMRTITLSHLYKIKPHARQEVAAAAGIGVFSSYGAQFLISTTSNGFGIVRNNRTGEETFMRGFRAGAGLGIGVKDYRVVVLFKDEEVLNDLISNGWAFDAKGEVGAKVKDTGGDLVGEKLLLGGRIKAFLYTEQGALAGASLGGAKLWVDKELN